MFTGIIEMIGTMTAKIPAGPGYRLLIDTGSWAEALEVDDSVAVNGICLTVTERTSTGFSVDAVAETADRSAVASWQPGKKVNLERGLPVTGRFDGHIVQGHIDGTATLLRRESRSGSVEIRFQSDPAITSMIVEKGSIAIDGVSLTIASVRNDSFTIAVIPYTLEHTTLGGLRSGDKINIETDIIGKYVLKHLGSQHTLNKETLRTWGYEL